MNDKDVNMQCDICHPCAYHKCSKLNYVDPLDLQDSNKRSLFDIFYSLVQLYLLELWQTKIFHN